MTGHIDLVLCKHLNSEGKYLFQAPAYSGLQKGDMIIVETKHGNELAVVEQKTLVEAGSELHDFLIEVTKATLPLRKVLGKFTYSEFKYKDE